MNKFFPMAVLGALLAFAVSANSQESDEEPSLGFPEGTILMLPAPSDMQQIPEGLRPPDDFVVQPGFSAIDINRSIDANPALKSLFGVGSETAAYIPEDLFRCDGDVSPGKRREGQVCVCKFYWLFLGEPPCQWVDLEQ